VIATYTTTLTTKEQLADDVWRFIFTLEVGQTLDFQAGQYLLLKVDGIYRQYSLSSPPSQNTSFEIIMEIIPQGVASQYLDKLQIGEKAEFRGPAGVFILQDTPKDKLFLATGTGIAPIKSMIINWIETHRASNPTSEVGLYLFFGLRTRQEVYLFDNLKKLAEEYPKLHFKVCLSRENSLDGLDGLDGNYYLQGRMTPSVEALVKEKGPDNFEYYLCGGQIIVEALKQFVLGLGAQSPNIFFEKFT